MAFSQYLTPNYISYQNNAKKSKYMEFTESLEVMIIQQDENDDIQNFSTEKQGKGSVQTALRIHDLGKVYMIFGGYQDALQQF